MDKNRVKIELDIPKNVEKNIRKIVKVFHENGKEIYLIGGSVRDLLLKRDVYDFDFATNAKPKEMVKFFKKVIPTGIKHGTVTILLDDDRFEVTTYRSDGKYSDGRRPDEIKFAKTLEEDVQRRDFTMNGLAYDVEKNEIIDFVGGLADISNGIIRTIGSPIERFQEDGLRPYRGCRFAAKLGFEIEEQTFAAISQTLDVSAKISAERIHDELFKMMEAEKPSVGFDLLRDCGLLKQCLPELYACYGVDQNKYHSHDVYYHCVYSCDGAPKNEPLIRWAAVLHDIGKVPTRRVGADGDYTFYNHEIISFRMAKRIMTRLKFSNDQATYINNLIVNHMFHYTPDWTDGAVRRFMKKVGVEMIPDLILLRLADRYGNGSRSGMPAPIKELQRRIAIIVEQENAITVKDLDINGTVLMKELNLTPGPQIGEILHELLEIVLDEPEKNQYDVLIAKAQEIVAVKE